jgi:hypothetical protein
MFAKMIGFAWVGNQVCRLPLQYRDGAIAARAQHMGQPHLRVEHLPRTRCAA